MVFCNFAREFRIIDKNIVISYGKESNFDDSRRMGNR